MRIASERTLLVTMLMIGKPSYLGKPGSGLTKQCSRPPRSHSDEFNSVPQARLLGRVASPIIPRRGIGCALVGILEVRIAVTQLCLRGNRLLAGI